MTLAKSSIGIDISKTVLDIFDDGTGHLSRTTNDETGIASLAAGIAPGATVIFEATGSYDRKLRLALDQAGIAYMRVNPNRARDFAKAAGYLAKTDAIDARMLAAFGRAIALKPADAIDPVRERLANLNARRDQLVDIRADEKKRCQQTHARDLCDGIERHIKWLDGEIRILDTAMTQLIAASSGLQQTKDMLKTAPGVGPVTAFALMAQLPELGHRSAKTIAALAGLAPFNNDSGERRGKRSIKGGRGRVRRALYMAALSAIRKVPRYAEAYKAIATRSGSVKVAIIAIARKLLVALNAMLRTKQPFRI
jgi:transposase